MLEAGIQTVGLLRRTTISRAAEPSSSVSIVAWTTRSPTFFSVR